MSKLENENIAVMVYGQFRSFEKNIENNLKFLYEFFGENNNFLFFILTDKKSSGNYSLENELKIRKIIENKANHRIMFLRYVESYRDFEYKENKVHEGFYNNIMHQTGVGGSTNIGKLTYKKSFLNNLKNKYLKEVGLDIKYHIFIRLFDITIKKISDYNFLPLINDKSIVGSLDTIFIGTKKSIDFLLNLDKLFKNGIIYHDFIWEYEDFLKSILLIDNNFYSNRLTYCPEIQYIAHLFFNNYLFYNIRLDYTNPNIKDKLVNECYDIRLCPNRFDYIS